MTCYSPSSSPTCPTVTDNICISLGESYQFNLAFFDSNDAPKDMTGKSVILTVAASEGDTVSLHRQELPVTGGSITITVTSDDCDQIGSGVRYYDIWLTNNTDYDKPVVKGQFNIKRIPGSS